MKFHREQLAFESHITEQKDSANYCILLFLYLAIGVDFYLRSAFRGGPDC